MKSVSEQLAKVWKKYGIETIHRPVNKLKGLVCSMKQPVHPLDRDGVIYDVDCRVHTTEPGKTLYIGETDRPQKERGCEHRIISNSDATKCHSCVPFEVNAPPQIEEPRRSQRQRD